MSKDKGWSFIMNVSGSGDRYHLIKHLRETADKMEKDLLK